MAAAIFPVYQMAGQPSDLLKTGERMVRHWSFSTRIPAVAACGVMAMAQPVSADVLSALSAGVQCAKAGVEGVATVTADMAKKAAAASEAAAKAGACTAVQGGNAAPFAITLGALSAIKIASPQSLPDQQCFSSVKKHLARPLAEGLALAVPIDSVKSTLVSMAKSELASDALWEALDSTPLLTPYTLQVDCACTTIDAGMTLADFSAISGAVQQASKSCGKFLDEVGLGFINDFGDAAIDGVIQFGEDTYDEASGAWDKHVLGQSKHAGPEEVYGFYFGRYEYEVASTVALDPGYMWNQPFAPYLSFDELYDRCVVYYDDHTMSAENAHKTCQAHRERFWSAVKPAGDKLREYGELPGYYFNTVKFLVEKDWRKRLPMRVSGVVLDASAYPPATQFREWTKPESESLFQDIYGSLGAKGPADDVWEYPNATGGLRAAREAMATTQPSKEQATIAAYTGLKPRLSQSVIEAWNADKENVTSYWLDKMLPGDPMAGRYGCQTAPFEEPCIARLRSRFQTEEICFPEISRRMAEMPTYGQAVLSAGLAVGGCKSKLAMTVERARFLGNYELINPAGDTEKFCAGAGSDRNARAECGADLKEAADACLIEGIAKGQGDDKVLACYAGRAKRVAANLLGKMIDPSAAPKTAGPIGGKIKLRGNQAMVDEAAPEAGEQPADNEYETAPRLKNNRDLARRKAIADAVAGDGAANGDPQPDEPAAEDASPPRNLRKINPGLKAIVDAVAGAQSRRPSEETPAEPSAAEEGAAEADPASRHFLTLKRKQKRPAPEQ